MPDDLALFARSAIDRVRSRTPLVQCLTNTVVSNFTANTLLALGAAPAMVDIPVESGNFASVAGGILVNLGTPSGEQRLAMVEAASEASVGGTPWVLDPVGVGILPVRTALARQLVELRPTVIRGNPSEVLVLADQGDGGRGVDATESVEEASTAAVKLALTAKGVVAVSGPVDFITDGERAIRVANGDRMLTRITGGGCALGAVMAAFAAIDADRLMTTAAAAVVYGIAAELAVKECTGPGSFVPAFLDALANLDGATVAERALVV